MEIVDANLSLQLRGFFPDYQWNYVADAILERTMGKVLVDDLNNPQVVALTLPKFRLHIMGGDANHPAARDYLSGLSSFTTLFVGKSGWKDALDETLAGKVVILKRYAFSSESLDIENLKSVRSKLAEGFRLEKINLEYAKQIIAGKSDLADGLLLGFDSAEDFAERGFGYCTLEGDKVVCVAATAAVCSKGIEVQINTHPKYRGRGLASATGAALIVECLEKGIDPNWDAASEISAGLAKKLGYTPQGTYDTYFNTGSRFLVKLRNFLRKLRGKEI